MKDCFKRFLLPSLASLFFAGAFFGSCTDVDNQLGLDLLPDDQDMYFTYTTIGGIRSYMALSDSLPINNLNAMALGKYDAGEFGYVTSGAAVQFNPRGFTEDFYGYMPKADTMWLNLYVHDVFGDTTKSQVFHIYKIAKDLPSALEEYTDPEAGKDSIKLKLRKIYDFNPDEYVDWSSILFSFDMKGEGTGSILKELEPTDAGKAYLQSLADWQGRDGKKNYEVYYDDDVDNLFRMDFPGLYITPSQNISEYPQDAALYFISPISQTSSYSAYPEDYSYLMVGYRSYYGPDDELPDENDEDYEEPEKDENGYIKTKSYVTYSFDDSYWSSPNMNIMVIDRGDYSGTVFKDDYMDGNEVVNNFVSGKDPSLEKIYIQGMMGVAGYLDFGQEFLKELDNLKYHEGEDRILNINRARLYMWLADDSNLNMDRAPVRLGMYYDYSGPYPTYIPDYNYVYEETYETETNYGGYLNRALGYYEMDVTMYMRDLLTDEKTPKQVWLGPGHTPEVFYTPSQVVLQNPSGDDPKRMQLKLTYTLLKKTIDE